ncbi:phosphatase PAP2 family protein [Dehalobacter sp. TeCB1]|uniref:phosphatase PAP2 family protein n=1 Tax=Dehalobacter sp. TeCB1 TaxID=1843715 RepID=UPI000839F6E9|nr:phosphatase PAP2 family protein [Dehalobacter sp. TeCB1]OCZ49827.1 hypothetical protein A7D23_00310 [Dehalobacter sp. TeCB1]
MKNALYDKFIKLDNILLEACSIKMKNSILDKVMPKITRTNNYGQVYVVTAVILWRNNLTNLLNILLALSLGLLWGEGLIKYLVKRERPPAVSENYSYLIKFPHSFSFPSGHTTSSFAVLGVSWSLNLPYKYLILALAVVISFSRVYLHVHYPSDIIGGVILGFLCAVIALKIPELHSLVLNTLADFNHSINLKLLPGNPYGLLLTSGSG